MTPIEFINGIRQAILERDLAYYQVTLENFENAKDPLWNRMLNLFQGLSAEQKTTILDFVRLIQVNTISHFLGILDGSSFLDENRETLVLNTEENEEPINGDLLDLFLEQEDG